MAAFLCFVEEKKLDALCEGRSLHKHFFGAIKIQRRGRLKWKIGITRSIIEQRRKRGVKMFPVEAHVRYLTLLKSLYTIKRSKRLWYYFYDALQFKTVGQSRNAECTASLSRKHLVDYLKLERYLERQGIENKHHQSVVLSHRQSSDRLHVAQVSDLETERLSDLKQQRQ